MTATEILSAYYSRTSISHPRRPLVEYRIVDTIKVKIEGQWVPHIVYSDGGMHYARQPEDFEKFSIFEKRTIQ